jgi:hypothetical protein
MPLGGRRISSRTNSRRPEPVLNISEAQRGGRGDKEQWLKLLDMSADIRELIAANDAQLKSKE